MTDPKPADELVEGPAGPAYEGGRSPFRPRPDEPIVQQLSPVTGEIPGYRGHKLRRDVAAGLTVAALTIPSAMAFAELAGLPAVVGLYAVLLPTVAYTLLGSSKQLIVGPEGTVSALVAAAILPLAAAGSAEAVKLAGTLALLVGAMFAVAWVLRLGWIADYFSLPVLVGYLAGVGVVLIVGQLEKLLGLDVEAGNTIPQLVEVVRELDEASGTTLLVGLISLAILVPFRFIAPKFPAALVVVVGAIAASWALDLQAHGVATLGDVPSGLPSFGISLGHALTLLPAALGIVVVSYADGVLTARSFAGRHGQHVRSNQELLAFAGMSAAAGVSQGLPVGASGSRTAVNDQMGSRTQFAGLIAAGVVLLVVLFLTDPIGYLPTAVLGAIIVSAAIGLIDPAAFRDLWQTSRFECLLALVTAMGVVTIGVLRALIVAVVLSIVDVVRRSARPHDAVLGWVDRLGRWGNVSLHPSARLTQGVVVYRLDDRLFFANADYVKGRVHEAVRGAPYPVEWLVFDADAVSNVDVTGAEALEDLVKKLRGEGIGLAVACMRPYVHEVLEGSGVVEVIGESRFFPTVRSAVAWCSEHDPADSRVAST